MIDLDGALRADAARWKSAQTPLLDLDAAVETAAASDARPHRRRRTVLAAAAAVVVVSGGVALIANRAHDPTPQRAPAGSSGPAPTLSSSAPRARLSGLGTSPPGQHALLRASGRGNQTSDVDRSTGRGTIYAACVGGGTITIAMPGHGGFDVDCTGTAAGASLPTLGRTVRVSGVADQRWRVAVFGH